MRHLIFLSIFFTSPLFGGVIFDCPELETVEVEDREQMNWFQHILFDLDLIDYEYRTYEVDLDHCIPDSIDQPDIFEFPGERFYNDDFGFNDNWGCPEVPTVPEPSTLILFSLGAGAVAYSRRKRK